MDRDLYYIYADVFAGNEPCGSFAAEGESDEGWKVTHETLNRWRDEILKGVRTNANGRSADKVIIRFFHKLDR